MVESLGHSEKIGVISPVDMLQYSLKKEALYFDKIMVTHVKPIYFGQCKRPSKEEANQLTAEREYLLDKGFLLEAEHHLSKEVLKSLEFTQASRERPLLNMIAIEDMRQTSKAWQDYLKGVMPLYNFFLAYDRTEVASHLIENGFDALPIFNSRKMSETVLKSGNDVCFSIILESFPVPHEIVPWDDILQFRNESKTKQMVQYCRNWQQDIAKMQLPPKEIKDRFDALKDEYIASVTFFL